MLNKKLKILISSFLISTVFVSLPFQNREVKAIAGVDDAILFSIYGLLAMTGLGSCYGISKTGVFEKTGDFLVDTLQEFGDGFKAIENGKSIAKSTFSILPKFLEVYDSSVSGTEIEEYSSSGDFVGINTLNSNGDYSSSRLVGKISGSFIFKSNLITEDLNLNGDYYIFTASSCKSMSMYGNNIFYISSNPYFSFHFDPYLVYDNYNSDDYLYNLGYVSTSSFYPYEITGDYSVSSILNYKAPSLNDVTNPPVSISLDKDFCEYVAFEYCEEYSEDNNGDKNVNYSDLIPFVFDLLEKDLGNGEITPTNLCNSGLISYVYYDGQIQGLYPYSFSSGDNINVEQNVVFGSDVSEEEKNGILNMLDNGIRNTTERLQSLGSSLTGFKDNISNLFSFLPEDVVNLLYLGISLSVVFFILGLRR